MCHNEVMAHPLYFHQRISNNYLPHNICPHIDLKKCSGVKLSSKKSFSFSIKTCPKTKATSKIGHAKISCASRTQSHAHLNSADTKPRMVEHNRKSRHWFSRKYYASVMRIKEFYEDNIGRSFTGISCYALSEDFGRYH